MRLAAMYIDEHQYLFKEPQMLNFGGKYLYKVEIKDDKVTINRETNENFMEDFYGEEIEGVSAIVGGNGVGKTSVMRLLSGQVSLRNKVILIYEERDRMFFISKIDKVITNKDNDLILNFDENYHRLYYSPNIDYSLKDISNSISQTHVFKSSLNEYHFDNLELQLRFLNSELLSVLRLSHPDIPYYDSIHIEVNNVNKDGFLKIYKESNLGKNFDIAFNHLWNLYGHEGALTIHQENDFIKDLEVFLLTLLITDDIFVKTSDNGNSVSFDDAIDPSNFNGTLDRYLEKCIDNIDAPIYKSLKESNVLSLTKYKEMIEKVNSGPQMNISGGIDLSMIRRNIVEKIYRFKAVKDFYDFIGANFKIEKNKSINIGVESLDFTKWNGFFRRYNHLISSFQHQPIVVRVLNIYTNKRLSTGEKSLLDLYSSFFDFTQNRNSHKGKKKNYLLLLDEPDQGYHFAWKKRFVSSITKVLPIMFKELENFSKIQIIFTTHDALTLSDIPNSNIVYLNKNSEHCYVVDENNLERPVKSFGANITDLMADSFFIRDGLMGDFAKDKINKTIKWLREDKDLSNAEYHRKVIQIVDEPIIKRKLAELYSDKFHDDISKENERKEITRLISKYKEKYNEDI